MPASLSVTHRRALLAVAGCRLTRGHSPDPASDAYAGLAPPPPRPRTNELNNAHKQHLDVLRGHMIETSSDAWLRTGITNTPTASDHVDVMAIMDGRPYGMVSRRGSGPPVAVELLVSTTSKTRRPMLNLRWRAGFLLCLMPHLVLLLSTKF